MAKFNPNGALAYLTFLGGADNEWANDLVVDSEDNVVITGFTVSDDFPTVNSYQEERSDYSEMFITKFTPDGQDLVFSTYLGGSSPDHGNAVAIDSQDRIIITGKTQSADFPLTYPCGIAESYFDNASLVVLNQDGSLLFSMAFGGDVDDVGIGVAWHSYDSYIVIGYTESADFPIYEAYQDTIGGDFDMFVMKVDLRDLIDISSTTTTATTTTTSTTDSLPFDSTILLVLGGGAVAVVVVLIVFVRLRRE
ncbi:MAG: SBBP repeat-containing protein [Promethearchaeota archaeon]